MAPREEFQETGPKCEECEAVREEYEPEFEEAFDSFLRESEEQLYASWNASKQPQTQHPESNRNQRAHTPNLQPAFYQNPITHHSEDANYHYPCPNMINVLCGNNRDLIPAPSCLAEEYPKQPRSNTNSL